MNNSIGIENIVLHENNKDVVNYKPISFPIHISPGELYSLQITLPHTASQLHISIFYKNLSSSFDYVIHKVQYISKPPKEKMSYVYKIPENIKINEVYIGHIIFSNTSSNSIDNIIVNIPKSDILINYNKFEIKRLEGRV